MTYAQNTIDAHSKLPLYHQLYEILRKQILSGELAPGALAPAESELTARHQVSRTTVRQVYDILVKEGLVYRQRGRGTFVAHRNVEHELSRIVSFTEDMRRRNFAPGARVLSCGLIPASADIAAKLGIAEGEELAHFHRVRLADGEPMAVEESFLVHRLFPGIAGRDQGERPLQDVVFQYIDRWSRAVQAIQAVPASREMARMLGVPRQAALLYVERVSYTQQNIPAEFLKIYYRGDRYTLFADLHG